MSITETAQNLELPVDRKQVDSELKEFRKNLIDTLSEVRATINIFNDNTEILQNATQEGKVPPELLESIKQLEKLSDVIDKVIKGQDVSKVEAEQLINAIETFGKSVDKFNEVITVDLGSSLEILKESILSEDLPESVRKGFLESAKGIVNLFSDKINTLMNASSDQFISAVNTDKKFFISLVNKLDKESKQRVFELEQTLHTTTDEVEREKIVENIKSLIEPIAKIPVSLKELESIEIDRIKFDKDTNNYLKNLLDRIQTDVTDVKVYSTLRDLNRNTDKLILTNREIQDTLESQTSWGQSLKDLFLEDPRFGVKELGTGAIQTALSAFGLDFLSPLVENIDVFDLLGKGIEKLGKKPSVSLPTVKGIKTPGRFGGLISKAGGMSRFLGPIGLLATAATSVAGGISGWQEAENIFKTEDASLGQKLSAGLGGTISNLTFGLISKESLAKGIYGLGSKVTESISEFFNKDGLFGKLFTDNISTNTEALMRTNVDNISNTEALTRTNVDNISNTETLMRTNVDGSLKAIAPVRPVSSRVFETEVARRVEGKQKKEAPQVVKLASSKKDQVSGYNAKSVDDKDLLIMNTLVFE